MPSSDQRSRQRSDGKIWFSLRAKEPLDALGPPAGDGPRGQRGRHLVLRLQRLPLVRGLLDAVNLLSRK